MADGRSAAQLADEALVAAGFGEVRAKQRVRSTGVTVDLTAVDAHGQTWLIDVCGPHTGHRGGLLRMEVVWRSLGRAHALRGAAPSLTPAPADHRTSSSPGPRRHRPASGGAQRLLRRRRHPLRGRAGPPRPLRSPQRPVTPARLLDRGGPDPSAPVRPCRRRRREAATPASTTSVPKKYLVTQRCLLPSRDLRS